MPYTVKKPRSKKRLLLAALVGVLLIAFVALYFTNHLPFWRRHKTFTPSVTGSAETKGEPAASKSGSKGSSNTVPATGQAKNEAGTGSTSSTAKLLTPTGNFVNTHTVSLSNGGGMTSNCTTTPGATCTISFTKDGITRSLATTTTDAGGSAYWDNWKLNERKLTKGSWVITATVKLGSQTQTATDAMNLEVNE